MPPCSPAWLSNPPPRAELIRSLDSNHAAYLGCFWSDVRTAPSPQKADGGGSVVPAMGKRKQPRQGFKEKVTCPGTETCHATLSKSLINLHDPTATSRSSKVRAGVLCIWTPHPLRSYTFVTWAIWQLTAPSSSVWRGQLCGQCQYSSSPCLYQVLSTREGYFPGTSKGQPVKS